MTTAGTPRDYTVLLPPGWARIPLDGKEGARATALAAQKTAAVPASQRHEVRERLARMLRSTLRDARSCGGIDVLLSLAERDGVPLAASCLVGYLDRDSKVPLDMLCADLSASGHAEIVTIPSGSAVRHRYADPDMVRIGYFLPVPGRTGLLTFAFATPVEPLAEPFTLLFDAIAESLRWQT
jgi:hypothetical protein